MLSRILAMIVLFFAGIQTSWAANVNRVYEGTGDVALVFFHGLAGHWENSFTQSEDNIRWFDLIRSEGDDRRGGRAGAAFHIYSVDYADAFAANTTIDEIATQVTHRSDFKALFIDHNHLFFVSHSMGGLVLKRALIQIQQRGQTRYLNRVIGAALLGVPSEGSELADLANQAGGLGRFFVTQLGADLSQVKDMRTVASGNSFLGQLQGDWGELVEARRKSGFPFVVACAYENRPEISIFGNNLLIVPRLYTSSTCSGRPFPLNVTHMNLPKPIDANANAHDWLLGSIREALTQLEDAKIVSRPSTMSLDVLLDIISQERRYIDKVTKLPGTDEDIRILNDSVRSLYLKEEEYHAPTYARLLQRIAEDHSCLLLETDERQRRIELRIEGALECASSSKRGVACRMKHCPD